MDVWVSTHPNNAAKLVEVLRAFGFGATELEPTAFMTPDQVIRMGVPPLRIEILTGISGVRFPDCYARRVRIPVDDFEISMIDAADLRANKRAAGRHRDLDDLDHLRE